METQKYGHAHTSRKNHGRSEGISTGTLPAFVPDGTVPGGKAPPGCRPGNAAGSPTSATTVNSHCQALPLLYRRRKMLLLEPGVSDSRTPTHASKADVG